MPPTKWMMIAPGAEGLLERGPKNQYAVSRPSPGPGFDSITNWMAFTSLAASVPPSGARKPWLMALFRNSTLAGSTMMDTSGSRVWLTRNSTADPRAFEACSTAGPMAQIFFLAEDGIRVRNVTGVQTCALPIFVDLDEVFSNFIGAMIFHISWDFIVRFYRHLFNVNIKAAQEAKKGLDLRFGNPRFNGKKR